MNPHIGVRRIRKLKLALSAVLLFILISKRLLFDDLLALDEAVAAVFTLLLVLSAYRSAAWT